MSPLKNYQGRKKMNPIRKDLDFFTIEEIEKATIEIACKIPVTFNCDVKFSDNYLEQERVKIACPGCVCSVELESPEDSTIIGQFEAIRLGYFDHRIWLALQDNIVARIARINRRSRASVHLSA